MLAPLLFGIVLALAVSLALAWKWELGVIRAGAAVTVLGAAAAVAAGALAAVAGPAPVVTTALTFVLTLASAAALVAWRFHRDPERVAPEGVDVVVSPADGEVVYVRNSKGGRLPVATKHGRSVALAELTRTPLAFGDAVVVGIAMNFLDVHVNRAPISGHVTGRHHFPGRFASLKRPESVFENERATTVIERDGLQVAVVQIASRLVRQIRSFVAEGDDVAAGQRIGVIRFGSQVDLVVPARPGLRVVVSPGDRLLAGESIVAVVDAYAVSAAAAESTTGGTQTG